MKIAKNPNFYAALPAHPTLLRLSITAVLAVAIALIWAKHAFEDNEQTQVPMKEIENLNRLTARQPVQLIPLQGPGKPEDSHGCYEPYKWNAKLLECSKIRD